MDGTALLFSVDQLRFAASRPDPRKVRISCLGPLGIECMSDDKSCKSIQCGPRYRVQTLPRIFSHTQETRKTVLTTVPCKYSIPFEASWPQGKCKFIAKDRTWRYRQVKAAEGLRQVMGQDRRQRAGDACLHVRISNPRAFFSEQGLTSLESRLHGPCVRSEPSTFRLPSFLSVLHHTAVSN